MEKKIIGAVIAKRQDELGEIVERLKGSVEWMQLDVMDGFFVPNKSLQFDFVLPETENRYEAQLMSRDPASWIRKNADKFDSLLVHVECCTDPVETLELGRCFCKRVGFALNPDTPVDRIRNRDCGKKP